MFEGAWIPQGQTDTYLPLLSCFLKPVLFPCHGSSKPEVSLQRWGWYQRGTDVTCVFQSCGVVTFPSTVGIAGDGIEANQDNIRFILKKWGVWISSWFFRSLWNQRPSTHQANLTPKKGLCILQDVLDFVLILRMLLKYTDCVSKVSTTVSYRKLCLALGGK